MTGNLKQPDRIEEMPDRLEHLRKIAKRIKLDHPEYAAEDPSRTADYPGGGYRVPGPDVTGSGRGPHV